MKDKNELKFSTGEMGNTAFADQLMRAVAKAGEKEHAVIAKEVVAIVAPLILPDLDKIDGQVNIPTLEGMQAKINEEAAASKQWAEAAGAKLNQLDENLEKIRIEIRKIEGMSASALSSTAKNLLAQLKEAEKKELAKKTQLLTAGDDALKAHVVFSRLLEEIRGTDSSHLGEVRNLMDQVVKMGRYRLATQAEIDAAKKPDGRWPSGALFFEGKVYYSIVSDASKSNGQKALEAELRKLVDAAKMSKAATIKTRGNANLHGLSVGKPGLYYGYFPKRTVGDKKYPEGHILIELCDLNTGKFYVEKGKKIFRKPYVIVSGRDAVGGVAWMEGKSVPYFWVENRKVIPPKDKETGEPKRLDEEDFKQALRFINAIWALYGVWHKGLNPEAAKPKDEKPEGPALNPVKDTDMTGIVVEAKSATVVAPEKPKTKKAKKA